MNESTVENESKAIGQFELTDCGKASQVTKGLPILILFEFGNPPWNKLLL